MKIQRFGEFGEQKIFENIIFMCAKIQNHNLKTILKIGYFWTKSRFLDQSVE